MEPLIKGKMEVSVSTPVRTGSLNDLRFSALRRGMKEKPLANHRARSEKAIQGLQDHRPVKTQEKKGIIFLNLIEISFFYFF
jgi:hypothetical protein